MRLRLVCRCGTCMIAGIRSGLTYLDETTHTHIALDDEAGVLWWKFKSRIATTRRVALLPLCGTMTGVHNDLMHGSAL
jgi:hypothetical protein